MLAHISATLISVADEEPIFNLIVYICIAVLTSYTHKKILQERRGSKLKIQEQTKGIIAY